LHPLYANSGTGIYVGRGVITAHGVPRFSMDEIDEAMSSPAGGNPFAGFRKMNISKRGEKRKAIPYAKGQRPQNFLYMAFRQTDLYMHARLQTLGSELGL
jgi:hypothetical protein